MINLRLGAGVLTDLVGQQHRHPAAGVALMGRRRGVLVGKRNDGKPPWTFIAGEVEPGESIADAAVREVKEEAGLMVRAAHREIGRRVHPKTGRTMIYLTCLPVGGTDVHVGDPEELPEVPLDRALRARRAATWHVRTGARAPRSNPRLT